MVFFFPLLFFFPNSYFAGLLSASLNFTSWDELCGGRKRSGSSRAAVERQVGTGRCHSLVLVLLLLPPSLRCPRGAGGSVRAGRRAACPALPCPARLLAAARGAAGRRACSARPSGRRGVSTGGSAVCHSPAAAPHRRNAARCGK